MKKLDVTVWCKAIYNSSVLVPDDYSVEEAIKYAKDNLNNIPLGVLAYISDSDSLDEENCFSMKLMFLICKSLVFKGGNFV